MFLDDLVLSQIQVLCLYEAEVRKVLLKAAVLLVS